MTRIGAECTRCIRVFVLSGKWRLLSTYGTIAIALSKVPLSIVNTVNTSMFFPYEGVEARLVPLAVQFLLHLLPRRMENAAVYPL